MKIIVNKLVYLLLFLNFQCGAMEYQFKDRGKHEDEDTITSCSNDPDNNNRPRAAFQKKYKSKDFVFEKTNNSNDYFSDEGTQNCFEDSCINGMPFEDCLELLISTDELENFKKIYRKTKLSPNYIFNRGMYKGKSLFCVALLKGKDLAADFLRTQGEISPEGKRMDGILKERKRLKAEKEAIFQK